MITRSQYMDESHQEYIRTKKGDNAHRRYYAQFVTGEVKQVVLKYIGKDRLLNSTDPHFNDIGLWNWDRIMLPFGTVGKLKECGDYLTPAVKVCILKEAARQIVEAESESNS